MTDSALTTSPSTAVIVDSIAAQRDHWISECNALRQEVAELRALLKECADDVESFVDDYYMNTKNYPEELRRYQRDIGPVKSARALLERTKK